MFKILFNLCIITYYFANELNAQIPIPQAGSCATSPILSDFDAVKVKCFNRFHLAYLFFKWFILSTLDFGMK